MHKDRPRHETPASPARQIVAYLLSAALMLALACILVSRRTSFDHKVWYANERPESADDPRAGMTDDLIKHRLEIGMPRTQTRALLGNPDASAQSTDGPDGRAVMNDTDAYSLGFIGKAKDISTLELHYSEAGKLTKAEVVKR